MRGTSGTRADRGERTARALGWGIASAAGHVALGVNPAKSFSLEELYERLTFEQFRVTQYGRTEPAFDNEFHRFTGVGTYHCVVCSEPLFESVAKYNSGTGWPSFWAPIDRARITNPEKPSGLSYAENTCVACGAHLGHVFEDRKTPTRLRFCINSASLRFVAAKSVGGSGDIG